MDLKLLNIGCGARYHNSWVNIDVKAHSPNVIAYNILKGFPFDNDSADAVYHSHVLEHFNEKDGKWFIGECFRVLKKGGTIRIATPDLERIAENYLALLKRSVEEKEVKENPDYNWILLEMYDQTMRNESGGEMKNYLMQPVLPNEAFVYQRVGNEAISLRKALLNNQRPVTSLKGRLALLKRKLYSSLNKIPFLKYYSIGKFRNSGEVHYRMYDRYSLRLLLEQAGFSNVTVSNATTSAIPGWEMYNLDAENGITLKPDSIFIEATK